VKTLSKDFPNIAKEWHPTKNNNLIVQNKLMTPKTIKPFSHKKVWWKCSMGHEWQTVLYQRTKSKYISRCPECIKPVSEEVNLETKFPNIAKEWHPTKNAKLKPNQLSYGSKVKVWWKCSMGHEWKTTLNSRTSRNSGCQKCSKRNQSSRSEIRILAELKTIFENVVHRSKINNIEVDIFIKDINFAIEYDGSFFHKDKILSDRKKNLNLNSMGIKVLRVRHLPLKKINNEDILVKKDELTKLDLNKIFKVISKFSSENIKIKINRYLKSKKFKAERKYKFFLSYFPSPFPENSALKLYPNLEKDWNFEKNFPLTLENFSPYSADKLWWKCKKGHEWEAQLRNRTGRSSGCPYCSGAKVSSENSLEIKFPKIAEEWHPIKNGDLIPSDVTYGSKKNVWWLCNKGHEWQTKINSRTSNDTSCLICSYGPNKRKRVIPQNKNFLINYPDIASEWHPIKNKKLKPIDFFSGSGKRVWWLCKKGHEWKAQISNRTHFNSICPKCNDAIKIKRLKQFRNIL
jgi:very-short-patch-repair endonuclease